MLTLSIIIQRFSVDSQNSFLDPKSCLTCPGLILVYRFPRIARHLFPTKLSNPSPSALEVFHRVGDPDKLELFRTSPPPDISNHTWLNFSPWSRASLTLVLIVTCLSNVSDVSAHPPHRAGSCSRPEKLLPHRCLSGYWSRASLTLVLI